MERLTLQPIYLVAAFDQNRVIGHEQQLPWHLSDDLKHFKALTLGQTVLMGRKTYESIGRPLPNRDTWVLSRQSDLSLPGVRVINSLSALNELKTPLYVAGGAQIYALTLPWADRLYLTEVKTEVNGDAFFPEFSQANWQETERNHHSTDANHPFSFDFITYERKR